MNLAMTPMTNIDQPVRIPLECSPRRILCMVNFCWWFGLAHFASAAGPLLGKLPDSAKLWTVQILAVGCVTHSNPGKSDGCLKKLGGLNALDMWSSAGEKTCTRHLLWPWDRLCKWNGLLHLRCSRNIFSERWLPSRPNFSSPFSIRLYELDPTYELIEKLWGKISETSAQSCTESRSGLGSKQAWPTDFAKKCFNGR